MSLVQNRKAFFNYEIIEKYEAGIELLGFEVKSLRTGKASLEGAFVKIRGNEAFIVSMNITPYQAGNTPQEYDPTRSRKLLLNKGEIDKLKKSEQVKGLTIIPLSVYNKGRKIKIEIGVAKGKKKFDKRETIKKRDTERDMRRDLKS